MPDQLVGNHRKKRNPDEYHGWSHSAQRKAAPSGRCPTGTTCPDLPDMIHPKNEKPERQGDCLLPLNRG